MRTDPRQRPDPTPEEIRAACREIRRSWIDRQLRQRLGLHWTGHYEPGKTPAGIREVIAPAGLQVDTEVML